MSKIIEDSFKDEFALAYGAEFVPANPVQRKAFNRLVERHGKPIQVYKGFGSDNVVMVEFPFMTIGIEEDGYAHS